MTVKIYSYGSSDGPLAGRDRKLGWSAVGSPARRAGVRDLGRSSWRVGRSSRVGSPARRAGVRDLTGAARDSFARNKVGSPARRAGVRD